MIKEINKSVFYTICSHEFVVLKLPTERCDSGEHLKIYNDDGLDTVNIVTFFNLLVWIGIWVKLITSKQQ